MQDETKFQMEIRQFREKFDFLKEKMIAIYGIGRRTATLLDGIRDYNLIGLLDKDPQNIGKRLGDINIISLDEAEKRVDAIIINCDPTNYGIIYKRICHVKVPVYYSNGEKAYIHKTKDNYTNNVYWKSNLKSAMKQIDLHEIISFDFFDTLVMRRVIQPQDVFGLMEHRLHQQNICLDFMNMRQKAASNGEKEMNLDDIYLRLEKMFGISKSFCEQLKQMELDLEKEILIPRYDVVNLLRYAKEKGKEVYIVSDMYLPLEFYIDFLEMQGIEIEKDNIIISYEWNATKQEGTLWKIFTEKIKNEKTMLHIGDNWISDVQKPKEYGMDTYYIMSGYEMLKNSSLSKLTEMSISLKDSISLGIWIVHMCNSPFAFAEVQGKITLHTCEEYGFYVFGAMITKFMYWLEQHVEKQKYDNVIFFARDGYFLIRWYEKYCNLLNYKMTRITYLPVSRRLLYIANVKDEESFRNLVSFPYIGTFCEYLKSRFNVEADNRTEEYNQLQINTATDTDQILQWLDFYKLEIHNEIEKEKRQYLHFLNEKGLMNTNDKCACVDMGFYGTNQFYFQKLIHKKMDGYYFFASLSEENAYLKECKMYACFNDEDNSNAEGYCIRKKSAYLESLLTAPYGMVRYIDSDGQIVCETEKSNQLFFDKKEKTSNGIMNFVEEFVSLHGEDNENTDKNAVADAIYLEALSGSMGIAEMVMDGFYFDNDMVNGRETKLEI